ncbi:MAG: methyltransferase domain-containing protein [Aquincola sp.]|nr:methyltransferase domain-containing protein [Aquincola sp.]MDH4287228.1 methyltransferase domain-containing protein [Aquincola sp.]MDH5330260.1 methyltransferase domain-containing protein [Aquincola sp.]
MNPNPSVRFFDQQFEQQLAARQFELNPFELAALPHVRGKVLDYGCGLGNLAVAAARKGCSVFALDGSHAAIEHLRSVAGREALPIVAAEADLRIHEVMEDFDSVVCIGLLMFFDCRTAYRKLESLKACVRPGGVGVFNVLIEGTTYMSMFSPAEHCLFRPEDLAHSFSDWEVVRAWRQEFPAPGDTRKIFATVIARKPWAGGDDTLNLPDS